MIHKIVAAAQAAQHCRPLRSGLALRAQQGGTAPASPAGRHSTIRPPRRLSSTTATRRPARALTDINGDGPWLTTRVSP